jgi:protein-arginine kinase activator protein McsA
MTTLPELRKMTVVKLREEAMKFPDVKGVSAMKKDQLIDLLCKKLGIEKKKKRIIPPKDKLAVKKTIRELKVLKQEALAKKDYEMAMLCRRKIRTQKRHLRKLLQSVRAAS